MFDASVLEVFVASTTDLTRARDAVEDVLRDWNSRNGKARQLMLKPLRWEKDSTPQLDQGGGQNVINTQLLDGADLLVGIFGKRLGSPTRTNVSGTVEEIERFRAAKKPVLLYFSDEPVTLSEIDPAELQRVNQFRTTMEACGLYQKFDSVENLEQLLRSHLDTVLQDFQALLIPAAKALAYGYFRNFIEKTHDVLRNANVDLPDFEIALRFESSRIRIAQPTSLDEATDEGARNLKDRCAEISILGPGGARRAFRIYVVKNLLKRLERAKGDKQDLTVKSLEVFDFPTPLIALQDFVSDVESRLVPKSSTGLGYWQQQKVTQYNDFFSYLDGRVTKGGLGKGPCSIERFDYHNSPDFALPP